MKPEDLEKKVEESIPEIEEIAAKAELMAAQSARVQLERRTFSTGGSGVKDIHGKPLSKYSEQYAKKREKAGLQTANKDLIFSSNTSVIKDNINTGLSNGKPALGFVKEDGAKIAGYQEQQNDTKIFQLNDSEKQKVTDQVKSFVMQSLRDIVSKWKE